MNTDAPMTKTEWKIMAIAVLFSVCGLLGVDIHLASLPFIMKFMHTNAAHMQQSVSIFLLGMGVSLLFYGPLSDKYGRKPIVISGLAFAALSSFACAYTHSINLFLFTRLLQGIGSGVCMGLGRTVAADVLQGVRFATVGSYIGLFLSLSPLLAPALGGYIQEWFGWQANFMTLGSILLFSLLMYIFFCPETNKHINPNACNPKILYHNYKSLLLHPVFMGATLITGVAAAGNMVYATLSPFIFQIQFHLTAVQYGWIAAIAGAGGIFGKLITPFYIKKYDRNNTLLSGLILMLLSGIWIACFLLFKSITISLIMIAVFFTIFGQGFINPVASSFALSPFHDKRGAAGALYGSFQMLTAFLSSAVVAAFSYDGVTLLAVAFCVLGMIGIGIYFSLVKNKTDLK